MDILNLGVKAGIYALMAAMLAAAITVVVTRNLFHSALALVGVLLGSAGIYLALKADFLAAVQVLLYVGAVMTLIIFVIMLTEHLADRSVIQTNKQSLPAAALLALLAASFIAVIVRTPWPVTAAANARADVLVLGKALMGPYAFPFEVISVVLIAALIGAVAILRKERP